MPQRTYTTQKLESLLGHLYHDPTVIPQGWTFLRQLISILLLDRAPQHYLRLNAGARADLTWWQTFLQDWNATSVYGYLYWGLSDASGIFGCSAFSHSHGWLQLQWPVDWQHSIHITAKELVPSVSAAVWGSQWTCKRIRFRSDNMAVVSLLKSRTSQDPYLYTCCVA